MPRIWSLSDISREVDASRQMVWKRVLVGHLPAPRYVSVGGIPYWSEKQAERMIREWVPDLRKER